MARERRKEAVIRKGAASLRFRVSRAMDEAGMVVVPCAGSLL